MPQALRGQYVRASEQGLSVLKKARQQFEPYVDIKDAAAFLGVSTKTIRRHCTTRVGERIPFYRFCGQFRFKLSEVDAWAKRTKGQGHRQRGRKKEIEKQASSSYDADAPRETEAAPLAAGKEVR